MLPPIRLALCILRICPCLAGRGLRLIYGDRVIARVDGQKQIALPDKLIIRDRQLTMRPETSGVIVTT